MGAVTPTASRADVSEEFRRHSKGPGRRGPSDVGRRATGRRDDGLVSGSEPDRFAVGRGPRRRFGPRRFEREVPPRSCPARPRRRISRGPTGEFRCRARPARDPPRSTTAQKGRTGARSCRAAAALRRNSLAMWDLAGGMGMEDARRDLRARKLVRASKSREGGRGKPLAWTGWEARTSSTGLLRRRGGLDRLTFATLDTGREPNYSGLREFLVPHSLGRGRSAAGGHGG